MMRISIRNILLSAFFLVCQVSFAQEYLLDSLRANYTLHKYYKNYIEPNLPLQDTVVDPSPFLIPLELPFFDDFSKPNPYPDGNKWKDRHVYINTTYPVNPVNIGVATFDGLKDDGLPYNMSLPTAYGIADYLTSLPINLADVLPNDSVYLSFYYQPQGLGNKPETKDSLVLEFYNSADSTWRWKWSKTGSALAPFKLVHIYVDTLFYKSHFQFRFRNYATLSGNTDHWHVDHVYLNNGRTHNDTIFNDVALMYIPVSLLDNYYAIPWRHYKSDSLANMRNSLTLRIRNNSPQTENVFYRFRINDEDNLQQGIFPAAPGNFFIINPKQIFTLSLPVADNPFNFHFPAYNQACHTYFPVYHYFHLGSGSDFSVKNDTAIHFQHFGNYYAYDDGSAEAAWGVQGTGTKVAVEYHSKIADTLTGMDLYFNPFVTNTTPFSFRLTVWSSIIPETKLYEETFVSYPQYGEINSFFRYEFSTPFVVSGKFYIGWTKISEDPLNIGFDYNLVNNSKLWYNAGQGFTTSSFSGSAMIRPVFGTCNDKFVGTESIEKPYVPFMAYPNPAADALTFSWPGKQAYTIQLYSIYGQMINTYTCVGSSTQITVSDLPAGMYILKALDTNGQETETTRLVIAR